MSASATARFEGGRGKLLETHANMTIYPQYDKDIKHLNTTFVLAHGLG